jgi:hypothetical protein
MPDRPAAHAGSWYPGNPDALTRDVDDYVAAATVPAARAVQAIIAPHAGFMFSGPIAAYAYKTAAQQRYDVAIVTGPSHYVAFDGVAVWPDGRFMSPLGAASVDAEVAAALLGHPVAQVLPQAHGREHSLEMQLPFLRRLLPDVPIVPIVMGFQQRDTIDALAAALVQVASARRVLLVASSDLSHFFNARTAQALDAQVQQFVGAFDADGLHDHFERYPEHERGRCVACGGGPAIAVMKAAKALGATEGRVLKYGHSGEISGDNEGVVGYLAAGFGTFSHAH